MTKLALSDEILMKIDKPARYIGNELNSVCKNKDEVSVRFAMCFPDVYEIGMSHHEGGEYPAVLSGITGTGEEYGFSWNYHPV